MSAITLTSLAPLPLWVNWRHEARGEKLTKIPLNPNGSGERAKADNPQTWATRDRAEASMPRLINGSGGGIGIEMAPIGGGLHLGGIDLDTCRSPASCAVEPWAQELIDRLATYSEVSPSHTGVKLYFAYQIADRAALREAMGTDHGKLWQRGGGDHPPAIELHIGNRYFAVTGEHLPGTPETIETIETATLLWLIRESGPRFKGKHEIRAKPGNPDAEADPGDGDIRSRLDRAAAANPHLRATLGKLDRYGSRSEAAMALGSAIKAAGWSYAHMCATIAAHPATAEWCRDKGEANGHRELSRIWDRANKPDDDAPEPWAEPDLTIARLGRRPPPPLPLDLFGPHWSAWITRTAEAGATAPDYVASNLLAAASALIGNARWPQATPGWREPPHLWIGAVGDSGTNKSSGADALMRDILPVIETRMIGDFPDRLKEWKAKAEAAKLATEAWQKDVRIAVGLGNAPPHAPAEAEPEPQAPRLRQNDVTVERVATLLAHAAPKGLLITRDELAGWLLGLTAYNDAGRAFWIEAFGGRPYRVERVKSPEPIIVPRLAVAVSGSTQPEKLAEMFAGADDGLLGRFIWSWPEPPPFRLSRATPGTEWAIDALDRLRLLDLAPDDKGEMRPINVPLVESAIALIERFGQDMQATQNDAGGLLRSAYGKARGIALRLSLVFEMLWWCGQDGVAPPPGAISERALAAACDMVADYFMPMAARVYGDAAATKAERNAATLARWIMKAKPDAVHVRTLQRNVRLPGLNTADAIHAAADVLVEAGWLAPPPRGTQQGRAKAAYAVNPAIHEGRPDGSMV
jgi:Uncharacterized conserved protein